jgi:predicted molibdopterin-dependent oxidoreductase YjgC
VRHDGVLRDVSWDAAVAKLASRLKAVIGASGAGSVAIVTDAARSDGDFAAVDRLARSIGTDAVACMLEPQDEALAAAGESAGAAAIEEAGCVIVFGDVFFSHPVLARQIVDAKYTARGNSLFVVDPRRSNTAWFASEYVRNRPGTEALVLASLLKALVALGKGAGQASWLDAVDEKVLLDNAGVSKAVVARMARAFADAAKAAIVVAPSVRGMSDVGLVSRLARLAVDMAGEGKSYVGLPSEGNVKGALHAAVQGGWKPVATLVSGLKEGRYKALVSIGADLLSAFPSASLEKAVDGLDFVASYSLFQDLVADRASVVLAGATWLESDGSAVLYDGSPVSWKAVGRPSWGVRTLPDVVAALEKALGAAGGAAPAAKPAKKQKDPAELSAAALGERLEAVVRLAASKGAEGKTLVTVPATGHSGAGGITRRIDWAREVFPVGIAEIGAQDAAEAGIKDGDRVVLTSEAATGRFAAKVTDRLQTGVVGVSAFDPAARALFPWESLVDGVFSTAPGLVRLSREAKQ